LTDAASIKDLLNQAATKQRHTIRCDTCKWLYTLDSEDAKAVQEAVFSDDWQLPMLLELLQSRGLTAKLGALYNHRAKQHKISVS
jgi:hypothetical protein